MNDRFTSDELALVRLFRGVSAPARRLRTVETRPQPDADSRRRPRRLLGGAKLGGVAVRCLAVAAVLAVAVGANRVTSTQPSPRPTHTGGIVLSAVTTHGDLTCQLPVVIHLNVRDEPPGPRAGRTLTGLVRFTHGAPVFVPASDVSGYRFPLYVPGLARWVEGFPWEVAPDGQSYAQATEDAAHPTSDLHLISAAGDRVLLRRPGADVGITQYTARGIVISVVRPQGGSATPPSAADISQPRSVATELVDPSTGTSRPLSGTQTLFGGAYGAPDTLWFANGSAVERYDLGGGAMQPWLTGQPGDIIGPVLGTDDSGAPLVVRQHADSGAQTILRLTAPQQSTVVRQTPAGSNREISLAGTPSGSMSDEHGLWVASNDGSIWLATASDGFQEIAHVRSVDSVSPSALGDIKIIGRCGQ